MGLALVVTRDFHIPLLHKVYEGNKVDVSEFPSVVQDLVRRYKILAKGCEDITLIFDRGNNSAENQALVITHHMNLLKIPKKKYKVVDEVRFPDILAYRTKEEVFGKERSVVITFNPQLRGILWSIRKKRKLLEELSRRREISAEKIEGEARKIVNGQYVKEIFRWRVLRRGKRVLFRWGVDKKALERIKRERLGKKILFTDNEGWTTLDIVSAYNGQYKIEHAFRQMKNPYFVSWRPMFHWTDQKIMVHSFYCVMALLIVSLLMKRVNEAGIKISCENLLSILNHIKEVEIIYPEGSAGVRSEHVLTELEEEEEEEEVYRLLGLGRYLAKR